MLYLAVVVGKEVACPRLALVPYRSELPNARYRREGTGSAAVELAIRTDIALVERLLKLLVIVPGTDDEIRGRPRIVKYDGRPMVDVDAIATDFIAEKRSAVPGKIFRDWVHRPVAAHTT